MVSDPNVVSNHFSELFTKVARLLIQSLLRQFRIKTKSTNSENCENRENLEAGKPQRKRRNFRQIKIPKPPERSYRNFEKMPCCAVPGCPTGSGHYRGEHYALHPFPKNDSVKKQWIENINRPNCVPSEHKRFYVCSKHFSPDCYLTGEENVDGRGRKRKKVKFLKPDAVPTLHFTIFTVTKSGLCCTTPPLVLEEKSTGMCVCVYVG